MSATAETRDVAKKKTGESPKRYGTLIRVSDEFAAALRDVTGFEKSTVAEFADAHLLPVVRKRYRDAVLSVAKRMQGGGK
jgi:hypothetical protein